MSELTHPVHCPKCRGAHHTKVGFTWSGGLLASKIYALVQCSQCGQRFSAKDGRLEEEFRNKYMIVTVIILGIAMGICVCSGLVLVLASA